LADLVNELMTLNLHPPGLNYASQRRAAGLRAAESNALDDLLEMRVAPHAIPFVVEQKGHVDIAIVKGLVQLDCPMFCTSEELV
jgi:hypothetical protein